MTLNKKAHITTKQEKEKPVTMAAPFIPYFIDYSLQNVSKTIGASKKKVTFKFGFANRQAIDDGLVGAHCRGSEHEVVFVWSLNSGKRHVTADGKDVHFSASGQNGWTSDRTWQHVFSLKVPGFSNVFRCHLISQPAPQGSTIRPFDLRVQGISVFKFNKIYELGTDRMVIRRPGGGRSHYGADEVGNPDEEAISPEERRLLAAARLESMREFRKSLEKKDSPQLPNGFGNEQGSPQQAGGGGDLLISFDAPSDPSPPIPPRQQSNRTVSSMSMGSEFNSHGSFPPQQPQQYGYPPQQQQQQQYGYAPQQLQQQPQYGGYGNQSPAPGSINSYGNSTSTAPAGNTTALAPYGQASPGGYSNYSLGGNSFGSAPTQSSTQAPSASAVVFSMDPYAKTPADPWATPASSAPALRPSMNNYGQQQPPQQDQFAGYPQQYNPMQSPAAQTQMSQTSFGTYGSAPDFARPPQQPQFSQPSNAYAPPPQYQYKQPGF